MFADPEKRYVSFERRRRSLRGVAVVALAAGLLAAPATAAAMPHGASTDRHSVGSGVRGGENLLAGSPRIGAVEALVPRRGRHAGRLIVWVRVNHAPGTARALARQLPETIHRGRVVARVGKRSRFATYRLELGRSRVAHGYFLRFSRPATRGLLAARGGRRVRVSVHVAQTLDLDSDGDREDRAVATTSRAVPLARPATSIEPKDGQYEESNGDQLHVSQGDVTHYTFWGDCQADDDVQVPISPTDGTVKFLDFPHGAPDARTSASAQGQFTSNTDVELDISTITNIELRSGERLVCQDTWHDSLSWTCRPTCPGPAGPHAVRAARNSPSPWRAPIRL